MRDYGIVSPKFWIGETGKKLRGDPNCQVLAMYLMTSPHATMTGVYHCPVLYMAHETGLSIEGATKALARLISEGYCHYDEASEYVFVIRMAAFQIGEYLQPKDRRVDGLKKDIEKMQQPFKSRFLSVYGHAYHLIPPLEDDSPSEAPSEPHRSQDQDQDQDQKHEQTPPKAAKRVVPEDRFEEIKTAYPKREGSHRWTDAKGSYRERLKEGSAHEDILAGVRRYAAYVRANGDEGTRYVQQAATFLGTNKGFLEDWKAGPKRQSGSTEAALVRPVRMFNQ